MSRRSIGWSTTGSSRLARRSIPALCDVAYVGIGWRPRLIALIFSICWFIYINVQIYRIPIKLPSFFAENFVGFILFSNFAIMEWTKLISNKRLGQEHRHTERHDDRTEFKRDYDRLIFSAPFRRLQNKTQVFPLPGSIFVHNRLTHSLEVASLGHSLGNDVAVLLKKKHPELVGTLFEEIGTIVSAACLAHDMGNPPFGHSGEKAIQTFFSEQEGAPLQYKL